MEVGGGGESPRVALSKGAALPRGAGGKKGNCLAMKG